MLVRRSLGVVLLLALAACRTTSSEPDLEHGLTRLSDQLGHQIARHENRPKVAVLPFTDNDGRIHLLGKWAAEKIITTLGGNERFELIERSRLDQVMRELKLSASEMVSDASAVSIGNLLGADALIIGIVTDLGERIDFNCRIVAPESGRILGTASMSIARDATVDKLLRGGSSAEVAEGEKKPDGPVVNLAPGGIASQSSTGFEGAASRAIDGNTNQSYFDGSCQHTLNGPAEWWQVDLRAVHPLKNAFLYNRLDCCTARLQGFWIFVSDLPFASNDPNVLAKDPNVQAMFFESASNVLNIPINRTGRFVRVQQSGKVQRSDDERWLHICELEVFGS